MEGSYLEELWVSQDTEEGDGQGREHEEGQLGHDEVPEVLRDTKGSNFG